MSTSESFIPLPRPGHCTCLGVPSEFTDSGSRLLQDPVGQKRSRATGVRELVRSGLSPSDSIARQLGVKAVLVGGRQRLATTVARGGLDS